MVQRREVLFSTGEIKEAFSGKVVFQLSLEKWEGRKQRRAFWKGEWCKGRPRHREVQDVSGEWHGDHLVVAVSV